MAEPTVLLLHAFPLDSRMWSAQRAALEADGYKVEAPQLPPEPLAVGFAAWARSLLGSLEGEIVPVGCSMGGYLALELWRQASERIRALVLIDTRAPADSPEQRDARDDTIGLLGEAGKQAFWDASGPRLFAPAADPELVKRAHEMALGRPITELVATLETLRDRPDSRPTLATIDVPVLVLVSEEDRVTPPAESEAMVDALANARFSRIAEAGHLSPLERPEEVTEALLGFLREVAA